MHSHLCRRPLRRRDGCTSMGSAAHCGVFVTRGLFVQVAAMQIKLAGQDDLLSRSVLEVCVLHCDLVALEAEDVAARDLDLLAVGARGREGPLRQAAITRHKVSCVAEMYVGEPPEHAGETFAHLLTPHVALAGGLRSRACLENAVLRHEGHEKVDVVAIPAIRERFQVLDGDCHRVRRAHTRLRSVCKLPSERIPVYVAYTSCKSGATNS